MPLRKSGVLCILLNEVEGHLVDDSVAVTAKPTRNGQLRLQSQRKKIGHRRNM
uniref:Mitochondrial ATP synthase 6kDa subunit n=1 Tax=Solanum tuberosum TaxID=4113 RepID=M1BHC0_SOLTU